MIKTITRVGLALSLLVSIAATTVQAGQSNENKTVLTFNQPVEVSGYVLPAGEYTFQLADSLTDRHIVLIFDANSNLVATVMAIPNYRFKTSDDAVIKFGEVPVGSPEVVRAWFYPGASIREEFVYPKPRAAELAKAAHAPVPAIAAAATDTELLKTAPIVAITPDEKEIPITAAILTTPKCEGCRSCLGSERPVGGWHDWNHARSQEHHAIAAHRQPVASDRVGRQSFHRGRLRSDGVR